MPHRTAFQLKSKKMDIIASTINYVKKNSVVLENGDEIPCDAILLGTGKANRGKSYDDN